MTSPDDNEQPTSPIARVLIVIAAILAAIFAIGLFAGLIAGAASHDGPHSAGFYLALLAAGMVAAGAIWLVVRNRSVVSLPASPRMRKSRILLYACVPIGIVTGVTLSLIEGADGVFMAAFTSDAPISVGAALFLLFALIVSTALSLRWHMLLDEHERAAYDFGAVASIYVYFLVSAGWWLLARGGLAPAPNGYVIFGLVTITWLIGWLIRRYR